MIRLLNSIPLFKPPGRSFRLPALDYFFSSFSLIPLRHFGSRRNHFDFHAHFRFPPSPLFARCSESCFPECSCSLHPPCFLTSNTCRPSRTKVLLPPWWWESKAKDTYPICYFQLFHHSTQDISLHWSILHTLLSNLNIVYYFGSILEDRLQHTVSYLQFSNLCILPSICFPGGKIHLHKWCNQSLEDHNKLYTGNDISLLQWSNL